MKPDHLRAALNGKVAEPPFCYIDDPTKSDIFGKMSPSGNSLLHVAASCGHMNIVESMTDRFPHLILEKNSKGDTALHVAVRVGKLNTVKKLVECAKQIPSTSSTNESLLKMKNNGGNTALHEALLVLIESKKGVDTLVSVARFLVTEDPEVSYHQNNASKSPLCLAVESGNKDILDYILKALPQNISVECLEGKSPVHVAIQRKKLASLGYFGGVRYLVEIKSDKALERNKEGFYPLHLACENGHVRVVQELLRKWPDPTELMGENGQSILHVAAKNGKEEVVRFLLKQDGINNLINEMDKDGNTPFHLAALHHRSMVVASLLWDKRLNPDLVNNDGLTTYDICQANVPGKVLDQQIDENGGNLKASGNAIQKNSAVVNFNFRSEEFQKMTTLSILFMYHEFFRRWCIIRRHQHSSSITRWSGMKYRPQFRTQDLNNTINNLFVVAALLVGAAFAGSIQNPIKDERYDDYYYGMLNSYLLNTYITMNLSITAALTLCLALLLDTNLTLLLVSIAFLLLELAFAFVGCAFFAATILTILQYDLLLRNYYYIYCINVFFVSVQFTLLTIPLLTLMIGWEVLALVIYFVLFCFYFILYSNGSSKLLNFLDLSRKLRRCTQSYVFVTS
ncbi:hypothetical protein EZV62_007300 [Acer yangbiense]|uniref:Uncharacterized protein n=1 Tax=Acer yangbiense TaxID=1000413 RepID=A0A5C7I9X6_9ROSI|nr:hypothetical protein EZV62_007300 [Acer yangbiense]